MFHAENMKNISTFGLKTVLYLELWYIYAGVTCLKNYAKISVNAVHLAHILHINLCPAK